MSIGPTGFYGTVAALPPSPAATSDSDRVSQETATQSAQVDSDLKAENAAGIASTDGEEHATAERDADGRRLFEAPLVGKAAAPASASTPAPTAQSKDPSGQSGSELDLTG